MVIRIHNYKDYNWTQTVQDLAYGCDFVKIATNRFHIKHNIDQLLKERVSGVAGKCVIKKHRDSVLHSIIVLFDKYQF
jgi:hypothetical protein